MTNQKCFASSLNSKLRVLFAGYLFLLGATMILVTLVAPAHGQSNSSGTSAEATANPPGVWDRVPQTIPPSRYNAQMAYDDARGQMVLFGGCCYPDGAFDDTWIRRGEKWKRLHLPVAPPGREAGSMVYDGATKTIVLFGGFVDGPNGSQAGNDTWIWDGSAWTERHPTHSPSRRAFSAMAFDAAHGQVVLFGGTNNKGSDLGDTWIWDGTDWSEKTSTFKPGVTSPRPRSGASMAYDAARSQVVFIGTTPGFPPTTDTWTWDGRVWTQQHPSTAPPTATQVSMSYDAIRKRIVLVGHQSPADTWTWDGRNWTLQHPPLSPPARLGASMDFDSRSGLLVLYGGCCPTRDDTWTWDGTTWSEVPRTWPQNRAGASMAYDTDRGQAVLFGGRDLFETIYGDTWIWNNATWSLQRPASSPPARFWSSMAYDAARKETVLFGGLDVTGNLGDTWTWDGSVWTERHPANAPPPRYAANMAYDAAAGHIILFGGDGFSGVSLNDTWIWNGVNWMKQNRVVPPLGREFAGMAYDAARGNVVLFGGLSKPFYSILKDTWIWDGSRWMEQHPRNSPSPRLEVSMGYDRATQQVVLFGGQDFTKGARSAYSDTWAWNGAAWKLRASGSLVTFERSRPGQPSARQEAATADGPRMLLFGGNEFGHAINDMWMFR